MRTWYAVVMNRESDWGTGSHNLREAVQMARKMDAPLILEIDEWEGIPLSGVGIIERR